ncbi:MAG: L-histidine N(alpha)-methyltransferase [Verrucomicrobia bacterium]|jgi:hypothetical protein|nr:L-histidine N(alpha)-methyltransferase [Verrucomicrobiota bacterium]MDA1340371.1 L-histidine N(alpha)-methyltransferase [Verrucomicrobiota bacterium]
MPSELPASALYSHPSLGRLWKRTHLAHSPFLHRKAVRQLYQKPAATIRQHLSPSYSLVALGCADGIKESLLLQKLPPPTLLLALDTNLSLARRAARRLHAHHKIPRKVDLTSTFTFLNPRLKNKNHQSLQTLPRLITLFGVLPNLNPLPLLRRLAQQMHPRDLLLFSVNLAPGNSSFAGARKVLPQYDNSTTRRWLEAAVKRYRPKLPPGTLEFGIHPDPNQNSLARIEARWICQKSTRIVFASRRPTASQVNSWIRATRLRTTARFSEPYGEEGLWLVSY